jgi:HEPN domain-containing protein
MKRVTAEWVERAEADLLAAKQLARSPYHEIVTFHCQQSAEKFLKAILEERGQGVPRTHNLVSLLPLLTPQYPSLRSLRRGLDFLTRFAVDTRYPGRRVRKRQAVSALRWAKKVRTLVRPLLGIRPPRKRRTK